MQRAGRENHVAGSKLAPIDEAHAVDAPGIVQRREQGVDR